MEHSKLLELDEWQMMDVNGGGFAYDVGRILRFVALGGVSTNPSLALIDWEINKIADEFANNPPQ